ncbi:MAG: hypothetical protein AAGA33_04470 [Pseudomonadota bacterium]
MKRLLTVALLLLAAAPLSAQDWEKAANIELQTRLFTQDAAFPRQDGDSLQWSLAGELGLRWRGDDARASIIGYVRYDSVDDERSLFDLREAYWAKEGNGYELLLGLNTVFWGVTESVHLVDIVNQTDFVSDIDGEDKLGQPMINLELQQDWGLLSFYLMPYFRERTFAGLDGRFRPPSEILIDDALYESSSEERNVDFAVRYSHYIGDVDIGLSYFAGTSREPRFVPADPASPFAELVPFYDNINQFGVDVQLTRDAWLWKLEAISRDARFGTFFAAVGGLEYTYYQVAESDADVGVLVEYQYDDRDALEPFTLADNDIFVGARLAMNDIQDTALLAGFSYDTDTGETFYNVEGERRLGDDWFLELRLRLFSGSEPGDASFFVSRDDYLQLQIARFF